MEARNDPPDYEDPLALCLTRLDRLIYRGETVAIGSFRCPPDDPLFVDSGPTRNALFVFPRTAVRIRPEGRPSFLASPNVVTFYNARQAYRRARFSSRGDECEWYWIEPSTLREVVRRHDPEAAENPQGPFRFEWGPSDSLSYLEQRRAFLHAATSDRPDPLYVEETILWVLDRVVGRAVAHRRSLARQRPGAARRQAELAEGAKAFLAARIADRLDLSEMARELGCSAYTLCRAFRRQTGSTLSEYQHQMRLRMALERIADPGTRLVDLAFELGYASSSHFTLSFRRAFGVTPSRLRARLLGTPFRLRFENDDGER
jgi:AraC family transcriptional regulator